MTTTRTQYVVGFLFTKDKSYITLIEKRRPAWQEGLYNGVGGHVECLETNYQAMAREFHEETGLGLLPSEWDWFLRLTYPEARVDFFRTFQHDSIYAAAHRNQMTDERVVNVEVAHALMPHTPLIPNLRWIIPFAIWHEPVSLGYLPVTLGMKECAYPELEAS